MKSGRVNMQFAARGAVALGIGLLAAAVAQAAPPQVQTQWTWGITGNTAGISATFFDGGNAGHYYIELGRDPQLKDARLVHDSREPRSYHPTALAQHATLTNLAPGTTYYYRSRVRTYEGEAVGPIQSFATAATVAQLPPSCAIHDDPRSGSMRLSGTYLHVEWSASGNAQAGVSFLAYSQDPGMKGAMRTPDQPFPAQPVGIGMTGRQGVNLGVGTWYVQCVATTSVGSAASPIRRVDIGHAAPQ